jgi:hypothetical protein
MTDVRDLEQEGILPMPASVSIGGGHMSLMMAVVGLQGETRKLRDDLARANDVMAGLAAKVRALEAELRPATDCKGKYYE